jgi:ubiquinone/menaquinone biosynthesis C-methylase UbiE
MSTIPLPPFEYQTLVCGPGSEGRFEWAGWWVQNELRRLGLLAPGIAFLDVGCGCGRIARMLMGDPIGRYDGFDRHQGMITWCNDVLAPRDPRFHFSHVSVRSSYDGWDHQDGSIDANAFVFPYRDATFDSILLASVFTHMPLSEIAQYLRELRRVLRASGKILLSMFHADGDVILRDDINFFHDPGAFQQVISRLDLKAHPVTQVQHGYEQVWYVVSHA